MTDKFSLKNHSQMELNATRLIVSTILIGLGIFYFINPHKALKIIHFLNKDYEPNKLSLTQYKYGGLVCVALGVYYILVMFKLLPI
jgi:uncharacterized membrane protein